MVATESGREGLVPSSFVRILKPAAPGFDPFATGGASPTQSPLGSRGDDIYDPFDDPFAAPADGRHAKGDGGQDSPFAGARGRFVRCLSFCLSAARAGRAAGRVRLWLLLGSPLPSARKVHLAVCLSTRLPWMRWVPNHLPACRRLRPSRCPLSLKPIGYFWSYFGMQNRIFVLCLAAIDRTRLSVVHLDSGSLSTPQGLLVFWNEQSGHGSGAVSARRASGPSWARRSRTTTCQRTAGSCRASRPVRKDGQTDVSGRHRSPSRGLGPPTRHCNTIREPTE
jgi:hypothetical protein